MHRVANESPYDGTSDIKVIGSCRVWYVQPRTESTRWLRSLVPGGYGPGKYGSYGWIGYGWWVWSYGSYGWHLAYKSRVTRFRYDLPAIWDDEQIILYNYKQSRDRRRDLEIIWRREGVKRSGKAQEVHLMILMNDIETRCFRRSHTVIVERNRPGLSLLPLPRCLCFRGKVVSSRLVQWSLYLTYYFLAMNQDYQYWLLICLDISTSVLEAQGFHSRVLVCRHKLSRSHQ